MKQALAVLCALIGLLGAFLLGRASAPARPPVVAEAPRCGSPPSAAGGRWECTFSDDFRGRSLDSTKWVPQTHFGKGTSAARSCFVDSPRTIAVEGGHLRLSVRKATTPVVCEGKPASYISGSVSTYHLFSQRYGRFAARIKVHKTAAPGLHEAFWLWPDNRVASSTVWPSAGEIDIAETYSANPAVNIPYLHYTANDNGGKKPGVNTALNCRARRGVFNTYVLTWTPTKLTIDINGRRCLTNTSGDPAFRKPYIVILTAKLGMGGNALTPRTPIPATMSVDYVRVWRWTGPGAPVSSSS
jgi:beta-glucanase (GH16 family)